MSEGGIVEVEYIKATQIRLCSTGRQLTPNPIFHVFVHFPFRICHRQEEFGIPLCGMPEHIHQLDVSDTIVLLRPL